MPYTVLIIDDELPLGQFLGKIFQEEGYETLCAATAAEGLRIIDQRGADVALLDMRLPDADGLAALADIKRVDPHVPVIVITAFGDVSNAVEAMKRGAYDYFAKPLDVTKLLVSIAHALETAALRAEIERLHSSPDLETQLIGQTPEMRRLIELVARIAPTQVSVLILGPSGTGKEVLARQIHRQSPRASRPFIAINCAAIPDALLESELFGYEAGAFTGALKPKKGLIESSHTGTLFLDEIGGMKLELQAKLLRVLEERRVRRLGSTTDVPVDIRILAASNQDLLGAASAGAFREDLYYRLGVIVLSLPPLCKRADDIPLFLAYFIQHMNKEMGRRVDSISEEALDLLKHYPWPGNVRELRNVVERAMVLCDGAEIGVEHLPAEISCAARPARLPAADPLAGSLSLKERVAQLEMALVKRALEESAGNQTQAARQLGISRDELRYRIKRYELDD